MKRASHARKTAKLSESVHQRLNVYAIAAGAAGASILALAQPSEAKIVYTSANVFINMGYFSFDLNNDGMPDLTLWQGHWGNRYLDGTGLRAQPSQGNSVLVDGTWLGERLVAAVQAGANIGYSQHFTGRAAHSMVMAERVCHGKNCGQGGHWFYTQARYLGVKFQIKGKTHFGWMRLKNSSQLGATVTGYAYETIPGKSIKAGQKKGAAEARDEVGFSTGTSVMSPIPDTPQPATLGVLALGAQGVPLWRRKETQEVIGQ